MPSVVVVRRSPTVGPTSAECRAWTPGAACASRSAGRRGDRRGSPDGPGPRPGDGRFTSRTPGWVTIGPQRLRLAHDRCTTHRKVHRVPSSPRRAPRARSHGRLPGRRRPARGDRGRRTTGHPVPVRAPLRQRRRRRRRVRRGRAAAGHHVRWPVGRPLQREQRDHLRHSPAPRRDRAVRRGARRGGRRCGDPERLPGRGRARPRHRGPGAPVLRGHAGGDQRPRERPDQHRHRGGGGRQRAGGPVPVPGLRRGRGRPGVDGSRRGDPRSRQLGRRARARARAGRGLRGRPDPQDRRRAGQRRHHSARRDAGDRARRRRRRRRGTVRLLPAGRRRRRRRRRRDVRRDLRVSATSRSGSATRWP